MSRYGQIRLLLLAAILVIAGTVWTTGQVQADADSNSTHALNAGEQMLNAMLDQETGLRGFIITRRQEFLQPYRSGRDDLEKAIADARRSATDRQDSTLIRRQVAIARHWQ